jgi:3-(3-hydroxy-phenyl)propionate hydroxylase
MGDPAATSEAQGSPGFQARTFAYARSPDQDAPVPARHPVVVVGAGPVGLALAIDLALQGVPVVLLDDDDRLSTGSRAICFAKRTLEIFDRLGVGDRMVAKGVSWNTGRVFFRDEQVYEFNLQPEPGHQRPAFINLQQYYVEGYLVERARELPRLDLRWKHAASGLEQRAGHVALAVDTPEGPYRLEASYVVACDGARSTLRRLAGLESHGRTFRDRFLIADVKMKAPFPAERWFWFDPPFHPNQSVLLHRQPDDVWRIDFQLGWDADPEAAKRPENIVPRVRALLGPDTAFTLDWASVYTFSCLRMDAFRHGRVFFAGDAAHGVSPFGARGANSGVQDADNLAWKLATVLRGRAGEALLASYGPEREAAADENIRHSTRATDFITPKSEISRMFRDATLALAKDFPFARALVNSGRLSTPTTLAASPLNTADADSFAGAMPPGAPAADAPVRSAGRDSWLLRETSNGAFTALLFAGKEDAAPEEETARRLADAAASLAPLDILVITPADAASVTGIHARRIVDVEGLLAARYDATPGTLYLLRPDQHVCARWREAPEAAVFAAGLRRALGLSPEDARP